MKLSVNVVLATPETIRIIYPSKEVVFDGKRSLAHHVTSQWFGQLANDLNSRTYLADLINQKNSMIFSSSNCTSDTIRKIQAIDGNFKLSEFFLGGQILIPFNQGNVSEYKIYLPDREMPMLFLGDYLCEELRKQINKLDLKQYGDNTILLAVDLI